METLTTLSLYITILALPFSQLFKPFFDISLIITMGLHLTHAYFYRQFKVKNRWFLAFIIYAWINLILQFIVHHFTLLPLFYLIRLSSLLLLFVFPIKTTKITTKLLILSLVSSVLMGLIQYIISPNVTYFNAFNWDPHLNRIILPFFDPTFSALAFVGLLVVIATKSKKKLFDYVILFLSYIGIALTYSRATWLSIVAIAGIYSNRTKKIGFLVGTIILIILTIVVLPKPYGEGTKLNRTASIAAKIENYKQAFQVIGRSPLIGVGYNRLSLVRTDQPKVSHAINGFDASLLTVWATTGIVGLFLFVSGLYHFASRRPWQQNLFLVAVLVHSCFANSLLYAPILFLLYLI